MTNYKNTFQLLSEMNDSYYGDIGARHMPGNL